MNIEYVAFIGIFLGCLMRTILPYLRKLKHVKNLKFEGKYAVSMIFSVVVSFVASMLLFGTFQIPEGSTFFVLVSGFTVGWASNDILNEIIAA